MRKFAWSAAIGCVLAYTATAANVETGPVAQPVPLFTAETSCRSAQDLDPVCAANDDATVAFDLGALSDAALPISGWTTLRAPQGAGLDFQGIAEEANSLQQTMLADGGSSHGLIPALLCLGGLVVLLRKRPM
jgi:hypothetical protein